MGIGLGDMASGDPEIHCPGCRCDRQTFKFPNERPFTCPKCNGQKRVSTPPWVAGDQETYSASDPMATYPCEVCDGKGLVWR